MKPSLSVIISVIFLVYTLHSIYNLIALYSTPKCKSNDICFPSYFNKNPQLDLLVYISEKSDYSDPLLLFRERNFKYNELLERQLSINPSITVRSNGSMFIHIVFVPARKTNTFFTLDEAKSLKDATYLKSQLTQYAIPKSSTFNLLKDQVTTQNSKTVTHLKSKFAVLMCDQHMSIPHSNIPPEIARYLRINSKKEFMPIVVEDTLQVRIKDLDEIKKEDVTKNFTFIYNPATIGKIKFLVEMEAVFNNVVKLGFTQKDIDEVKEVFADTNLHLLCATILIGGIHLLLDFLSFKNDVSFWKSNKSMAGLSTSSVLWRTFSQAVIFLYLLDEGTSLLVLIPTGIGTFIEFWKLTKVFKVKVSFGSIRFQKVDNNEEEITKRYDDECMKYLSYLLYPLCTCGAFYSLLYMPHKSWYSWSIASLVNGVYMFGFLFMLPQLFVNYRLKSVAALPWRAFTYRFFNTIIDDIFAFIITMPIAHRIACFRDDVVFLIYLYQRWLYPVDVTRTDDGKKND